MTKIYSFHVVIKEGKPTFKSDHHRDMFIRWLSQWNDKEVALEVVEKKQKRSEQQHRYYFFYLSLISEETGFTKDELHAYFKGKFLTDDIKEIFGEKTRMTKSTTELSVGDFCDYLANIMVLTEVPLPDTTEFYGYSYHKR